MHICQKPILVFQTDFTYKEGAVSSMYGVVKTVDRSLEIMDGTHEIPQFDTWSASYRLYQSLKFWPKGTIYVSVVDPGVGTARKACIAKIADGYYIVTPDNGSLTHIKKYMNIVEVREIDENINRLRGKDTEGVSVFHGRDLFGYCAARLASGIITYEEVGPSYSVDDIIEHTVYEAIADNGIIKGIFEIDDPNFGNLWTNIPTKLCIENGFNYGDTVYFCIFNDGNKVFDERILFHKSFGYAKQNEPILYNNELMHIGVAVSCGSFKNKYNIGFGSQWTIELSKVHL